MRLLPFAVLGFFASASTFAACPDLHGHYWCASGAEKVDELVVSQRALPGGVTEYTFDYATIPGEADVIRADAHGIPDDFGWVTKCTAEGSLFSMSRDGAGTSEIYIGRDGVYTRLANGKIAQHCPRKSASPVANAHRRKIVLKSPLTRL